MVSCFPLNVFVYIKDLLFLVFKFRFSKRYPNAFYRGFFLLHGLLILCPTLLCLGLNLSLTPGLQAEKDNLNHLNSAMGVGGFPLRKITPHGKSRNSPEVTKLMSLLTTRATFNVGTWNVRASWEIGRTIRIATETRRYKLTMLGLNKIH